MAQWLNGSMATHAHILYAVIPLCRCDAMPRCLIVQIYNIFDQFYNF